MNDGTPPLAGFGSLAFLARILPEQGPYILSIKWPERTMRNEFAATLPELWDKLARADAQGAAVYHACSSFKLAEHDPKGTAARDRILGRTHHNVAAVRALWLDVDAGQSEPGKPPKPYASAGAAAKAILAFALAAALPVPMLVGSGNGVHAYWPLDRSIHPNEWLALARGLKSLCAQHKLQADPARTADMSSVLRTPGTHNRKHGETIVKCFQLVGPYKLEQFIKLEAAAGILTFPVTARERKPPSGGKATVIGKVRVVDALPEHLRGRPQRDLVSRAGVDANVPADKVADHCAQLAAMRQSRGVMPEPLWYACLGVLSRCEGGEVRAHEWSAGYAGYTAAETAERLARSLELTGATTCARFHELAPATCEACPHWGKINSPVSAPRGMFPVDSPASDPPEMNGHTSAQALPPGLRESPSTSALFIRFPDLDKNGNPRATCTNTRIAIEGLGIRCREDMFHGRMEIGGQPIERWQGEVSDSVVQMVRPLIRERFGFDPGMVHANDAVLQLCYMNRFHPVRDYLGSLKWDGRSRLRGWLGAYLGAEASQLNGQFGELIMVAAVRRIRAPGAKFDEILVLEGPEGASKSAAIRALAGDDNFSDQPILTLDDRGQQEAMRGVWLYEIADLTGISRADIDRVKAFASRTVDRARPAYGRYRLDIPRQCVLFGTTNNEQYLQSQTGNRRWWPVRVGRIQLGDLARDRDQLWAEAAAIEARGGPIRLAPQFWHAAGDIQEARRELDPWEEALRYIAPTEHNTADGTLGREIRISTNDLLTINLQIEPGRLHASHGKRLLYVMRRLGWDGPKMIRFGDKTGRGYTKAVTTVTAAT